MQCKVLVYGACSGVEGGVGSWQLELGVESPQRVTHTRTQQVTSAAYLHD